MEDKKVIKDLKERNDKLKQQYDYNNIHLISLEKRYNNLKQENIDLKQKMIRILENIDVSYNDWKKWKDELKESDKNDC